MSFLEFTLPTAATWFYFSALLAVALFFKFSRLLSVRNWDVLTLFLFMPGFLLLVESRGGSPWGYLALFIACGYFLVRCLFDLTLVRRPVNPYNRSFPSGRQSRRGTAEAGPKNCPASPPLQWHPPGLTVTIAKRPTPDGLASAGRAPLLSVGA